MKVEDLQQMVVDLHSNKDLDDYMSYAELRAFIDFSNDYSFCYITIESPVERKAYRTTLHSFTYQVRLFNSQEVNSEHLVELALKHYRKEIKTMRNNKQLDLFKDNNK